VNTTKIREKISACAGNVAPAIRHAVVDMKK
jgi:hypothetical protein